MTNINALTAPWADCLISPRPGPGICVHCFNHTCGYRECYACARGERHLAAVVPISYSVAHEELHIALATYKRGPELCAERATRRLAATLWRFLEGHEACVARAAGVPAFDLVTTVPSGDAERDADHPLRALVGEMVGPTRGRYARVLQRTAVEVPSRRFSADRFECQPDVAGANVLLIDDMWTTGASAQSAAAALRAAGAAGVAAVVIGRHVNRSWRDTDARLRGHPPWFDWSGCPVCAGVGRSLCGAAAA